jgi:hypothetical protein
MRVMLEYRLMACLPCENDDYAAYVLDLRDLHCRLLVRLLLFFQQALDLQLGLLDLYLEIVNRLIDRIATLSSHELVVLELLKATLMLLISNTSFCFGSFVLDSPGEL